MFGSSMLLTVGSALDRAKEDGLVVRLHIGGEWVVGRIVSSDGHGVAVLEASGDICVVRQEAISCVRLPAHAASQEPSAREAGPGKHPKLSA